MGGQSAHGMERHRPTDKVFVLLPVHIRPRLLDRDRLVEGHARDFRCEPADRVGRNARFLRHGFRRIFRVEVFFRQQLKGRHREAAIRELHAAGKGGPCSFGADRDDLFGHGLENERFAFPVAREQAVLRSAGSVDHQPCRIGIAHQVVDIDPPRLEQFMHDGEDQQPVRAGANTDPVVGNGRIAGAHGVDRNEAGTILLQLGYAHLDRVGIVVLRDPEQHEQLGAIPVRCTEFPEGATDRHDAGSGHVDRAEAAMRGIIRRAELLCPETGQRLRLIPAGEEGKLLGIVLANAIQPVGGYLERLVPADLLELARAARPDPFQGRAQPGRRVVLHDAGRALGAQYPLVDRVVAVALDVADLAVLDVHVDAAPACTHVAGRLANLVRHRLGQRHPVGVIHSLRSSASERTGRRQERKCARDVSYSNFVPAAAAPEHALPSF